MMIKLWTLLLSIALVIQGLFVIQNENVELEYNISFYNHCQRDTHRIHLYHRVTISDCVTECGLRPHCKAMNYHDHMGFCELFSEVESDFTEDGCAHIRKLEDIQVYKTPCGSDCEDRWACDINTRTCVIKECMSFPNLENGVGLGNRKEVGMKIMTKCSKYFKQNKGIKKSIFTRNGTWTPRVECIRDCGVLPTPTGAKVVANNDTLEGSEITYACLSDFVHVEGTLTRVCQADGSWNETEPICLQKICVGSESCYAKYLEKNLGGHDKTMNFAHSFEECSKLCETHELLKSIEYCTTAAYINFNCFCKSATVGDGNLLTDIQRNGCNFYHKLVNGIA